MDATAIVTAVIDKAIVAILIGVLMWPFKKIKDRADEFTKQLKSVQDELVAQRTNCLTTLQSQGEVQIEVLNEISSTLTEMHLDQRTMMGKLD